MTSESTPGEWEAAALAEATENCAREAIHIPGSIQPHGFMIVFEEPSLRAVQVSLNVRDWLGVEAVDLLGREMSTLLMDGGRAVAQVRKLSGDDQNPFHIGDVRFQDSQREIRPIAMMVHRHDGVLIAEFEPARDIVVAYGNLYPLVRTFIGQMNEDETIEALCQRSVEEIKRICGFGRVKSYRFKEDGSGLVNAEIADLGYPSYLGLCFPASDIPPQARALYCANRIRVIEDANYRAAPLVPALNPLTGQPLDMSFAALRSVSPVHLQYMRNMQTMASMSISIVVRGKLWGLIACHNTEPRAVGFETRTACELLGSVLSLQIETKETSARHQRLLGLRHRIVRLLSAMADRDSVTNGLLAVPEDYVDFVRGSGAAIVAEGNCQLIGETPPLEAVEDLVNWLARRDTQEIFASDNIGRDAPHLPELARHCGGVLAVTISELHANYLIWFRPEQSRQVEWAGRPDKAVGPSGSLSPRHSFERWQETVHGYSTPWDPLEIEGVAELRTAVLGIVLRKAEELAQLAGQLRQSNKELEAFSYSVSHDLRAPLRHIVGYAELLGDDEREKLSTRGQRFLENIGESARFAGTLVDNLLSFSRMGRSAMRFSDVDLNAMVEAIQREMLPDYQSRDLEWRVQPLPQVIADAAFLHLAMRNLISNAIKYTRDRQPAIIEIGAIEHPESVEIFIRDNGVGFDMAYAGKLFGVFQRLHRSEEFEGTGIGLASVRRIVERHDGKVWANAKLDEGATIHFSLPRRGYPAAGSL